MIVGENKVILVLKYPITLLYLIIAHGRSVVQIRYDTRLTFLMFSSTHVFLLKVETKQRLYGGSNLTDSMSFLPHNIRTPSTNIRQEKTYVLYFQFDVVWKKLNLP